MFKKNNINLTQEVIVKHNIWIWITPYNMFPRNVIICHADIERKLKSLEARKETIGTVRLQ